MCLFHPESINNYLLMKRLFNKSVVLALCCIGCTLSFAQTKQQDNIFNIDLKNRSIPIQPTMYGVFFEDINFGADGGLYAELIKNRSFEFDHPLTGWLPFGSVSIETRNPCFKNNPHYARLRYTKELTFTGLENEGFRGIGVKKDEKYLLTMYGRVLTKEPVKLKIELVDDKEMIFEKKELEISAKDWEKRSVILEPGQTVAKASLRITLINQGGVDLDHISLFPEKTFKNRENGMREDLAQALKDLKPGVFRFPGGCIVEGNNLSNRYQWKHTIGPVEERKGIVNRWNFTFTHKKFSDYFQSFGLGFYEYFLLSEDLGAEPLPVLNCGLSCQYENHDPNENCPVDELQPYIDDALDLIEFANGPADSKWGKIRAEMGHPSPFNLKMIAIGNEQWDTLYTERLIVFIEAIRKKYPEILIIGSSGPAPDGKEFDFLWDEMKRLNVDLVDEHYYRSPEWFFKSAKRYDSYDRKGPKVFAGEYASHTKDRANSFLSALSEAAFMTGLERNADVVHLCTYAPLFAHVDAWQWRPDLIWFNNLTHVKTPNYYVQQMFGQNAGTHTLPLTENGKPVAGETDLYASAVYDKTTNEIVVKVVNSSLKNKGVKLVLNGAESKEYQCRLTVLSSLDLSKANSIESPSEITPVESKIVLTAPEFDIQVTPCSFIVYRIVL